jgi:hypothetical protein
MKLNPKYNRRYVEGAGGARLFVEEIGPHETNNSLDPVSEPRAFKMTQSWFWIPVFSS